MIKTIAEIGINHNGDVKIAKRLIDVAIVSGFDYVKFQKRDPDTCVPENKKNEHKETPWGKMTYLEYKKRMELTLDDYFYLHAYCNEKIGFFASVWDKKSADDMKLFSNIVKIPSALLTDIELIKYCREHFKTLILSTGMSTEKEIETAIEIGEPDIVLHTNSTYPAPCEELKLNYIKWLKIKYPEIEIGYSGHEFGLVPTFAAVALGAEWIERHITLDHDFWGTDQKSSVDPVGCIKLIRGIRDIEKSFGEFGPRIPTGGELKKAADLRK